MPDSPAFEKFYNILHLHTESDWLNTPCMLTLLMLERGTLHVHTAGGRKGCTLHVHTAGSGNEYTLHVHIARGGKGYPLHI
jgi:hypothetical protein